MVFYTINALSKTAIMKDQYGCNNAICPLILFPISQGANQGMYLKVYAKSTTWGY